MSFQDIITAIAAEADAKIAQARSTHQKEMSDLKQASKSTLQEKKQHLELQKQEKKDQMLAKARAHGDMLIRNAELQKKQEMLTKLYAMVAEQLVKLPDAQMKEFLESCLKQIKGKGTIHPAKSSEKILKSLAGSDLAIGDTLPDASGGFLFVSDKQERDFTFEHLVETVLRPATELETATTLFS